MRTLQRISAAVSMLALLAVGLLLAAEATGIIGDAWRIELADGLAWIAEPNVDRWAAALIGVFLATTSGLIIVAQFVPYRRSSRYQYVVDAVVDGSTAVSARALQNSIDHELSELDGVVATGAIMTPRGRAEVRVEIADSANVRALDETARSGLGEEFWARLGMDQRRIDIMYEFRRPKARAIV